MIYMHMRGIHCIAHCVEQVSGGSNVGKTTEFNILHFDELYDIGHYRPV